MTLSAVTSTREESLGVGEFLRPPAALFTALDGHPATVSETD